jgi:hypothetical protein
MPISWPLPWKYGDRLSIIGPSGSGKTELLKVLLRQKKRVLVIDSKQDPKDDWQSVGVEQKKLSGKLPPGRYVWPADRNYITEPDAQSVLFEKLLRAGPLAIGVDEAYHLYLTRGLRLLATQGRGKRVSLVCGMQRPRTIPLILLSDASYWFIFHLRLEADRKIVEQAIGTPLPWSALQRHEFSFVIVDTRGEIFGPIRLPDPKKGRPPKNRLTVPA